MKKIKICVKENLDNIVQDVQFRRFIFKLYEMKLINDCHIHIIDNKEKYSKWLNKMPKMPWKMIINLIFENADSENDIIEEFKKKYENLYREADVYLMNVMEYLAPVDNSELITSVYKWNYNNNEEIRNTFMNEHFKMEQRQKYYKYVTFNSVIKIIKTDNNFFDFFFESNVSDKNGIDMIYSNTTLGNMRLHSEHFLNTNTRLLSFGENYMIRRK